MIKYLLAVLLTFGSWSYAAGNGQPFSELKEQIEELKMLVEKQDNPIEVDVRCEIGESITETIDSYRNSPRHLVVNVSGECLERAVLSRGNLVLRGVDASAYISPVPSNEIPNPIGLTIKGFQNVTVEDLSITGYFSAVIVYRGGVAQFNRVRVENSSIGLLCASGASCGFTDSVAEDNNIGVEAYDGGNITFEASYAANNGTGAAAASGGHLFFQAKPYLSENKSVIEGSGSGLLIQQNATAGISGLDINTTGYGIFSTRGGYVTIYAPSSVTSNSLDLIASEGGQILALSTTTAKTLPVISCFSGGKISGGLTNTSGDYIGAPQNCYFD